MSMAAAVPWCEPGGILVTFDTTGWRLNTNIQCVRGEIVLLPLYHYYHCTIHWNLNKQNFNIFQHNPYFSILFNDSYKQNKVSSSTIFSLFSLSDENSFIVYKRTHSAWDHVYFLSQCYGFPLAMVWTVNLLCGHPVYSIQSLEPPDWCRTCTCVFAARYWKYFS